MPSRVRSKAPLRVPLSRERVLRAAMSLADADGLEAVTMRRVAVELGVEAMSLYKHVANKDDILDGLGDLVTEEMVVPDPSVGWRAGLRARALSAREVLLRHRWAAMLLESRIAPGPVRMRLHEGVLRVLRESGFSIELAYSAFLTLDSYIYGFTLQELSWSFEPEERSEFVESFRPHVSPADYPHLMEALEFMTKRTGNARRGGSGAASYSADFEFGLDLILDGFGRAKSRSRKHK